MYFLIREHLIRIFDLSFFYFLVVVFQLTNNIFEAVFVFDEGIAGEGDVKSVGSGFDLVHQTIKVLPAFLYNFFLG